MSLKQPSPLSLRYAGAFIDLAEEAKLLKKVTSDVADLSAMLESSEDLQALVKIVTISEKQQKEALSALAQKAGFQTITVNFLNVLVQNRRIQHLADILEVFSYEVARRSGVVNVQVQVAQDLTAAQKKALETNLVKGLGQEVQIEVSVQPDILGGMVVTVGSHMVDNSLRRKLERLQIAMSGPSNQNLNIQQKEA